MSLNPSLGTKRVGQIRQILSKFSSTKVFLQWYTLNILRLLQSVYNHVTKLKQGKNVANLWCFQVCINLYQTRLLQG